MPFAGELIRVREDEKDWEGAAERLLRDFGLSLLVPDSHYARVVEWVDRTHLRGRLVYFRVQDVVHAALSPVRPNSLVNKLALKRDTPFYSWLEREVTHRFDVACCNTQEEFRRENKAITRAGQIKGHDERHEKDDLRRLKILLTVLQVVHTRDAAILVHFDCGDPGFRDDSETSGLLRLGNRGYGRRAFRIQVTTRAAAVSVIPATRPPVVCLGCDRGRPRKRMPTE